MRRRGNVEVIEARRRAPAEAERKLDFQGDRIREGFKGRVLGENGVGPL